MTPVSPAIGTQSLRINMDGSTSTTNVRKINLGTTFDFTGRRLIVLRQVL